MRHSPRLRHTKAISDWCVEFGKKLGLEWYQDAANNVILIAPATAGYENAPAVILQGHLDMVCEKEPDCAKDMDAEGLDLFVDGDVIGAKGTTLGSDDGIAVAMALAALEDETLSHPRLEAVLTTEEEIGMLGAAALDVSPLRGRTMLNIDSEVEGVFTVGCAGGSRVSCRLPLVRGNSRGDADGAGVRSGRRPLRRGDRQGPGQCRCADGAAAAGTSAATEVRLVSAAGGSKDNAIPAAAEAVLVWQTRSGAGGGEGAGRITEKGVPDGRPRPDGNGGAGRGPVAAHGRSHHGKGDLPAACLPNGIQAMSMDIPGLVQTSLNLGILTCGDGQMSAVCSVRSSVASQKQMMRDRLRCLTEQIGGHVAIWGDYPAWEYLPQSPLRERMIEVYREQYGKEPVVETVHAGLECGLLGEKLPGLDCVSFGPDLTDIHTPRERMHIASVQRTWKLLCEVLKRSK